MSKELELPRIALVDDHPAMLGQTVRLLSENFEIVAAMEDGRKLLALGPALNIDAVVLDITLPGLSGIELAIRLREMGYPAKIVFLTVHADPDYAQEAFDIGALAYVVKPRLASDLIPALNSALAGRTFISPCPELNQVILR